MIVSNWMSEQLQKLWEIKVMTGNLIVMLLIIAIVFWKKYDNYMFFYAFIWYVVV